MSDCDLNHSDERYIAALRRNRARIKDGLALTAEDSTTIGDKFTDCSWGMCSNDKELWLDVEDHLFPEQFVENGRISPKYFEEHQACPLNKEEGTTGCFYSCRIFQRKGEESVLTREGALVLYDDRMSEALE